MTMALHRLAGRVLLGLLACFPLMSRGQGEPRLERPRVSYATSPRVHRYSWAQLGCLLQNPDTRPREVAVRLLMDAQGGMNQRTVMTRHVQIPARAEMYYRSLAMVEDADQYRLELFIGDRRVPGAESMACRLLSDREEQMAVINDDDEISFGSFISYDDLKDRWRTAFLCAADLPDAWPFFRLTHAVILLAPDFSRCSDRQLMALREYVEQGGRLILAHPRAIEAMAASPLADLLPMHPLRERRITALPALSRHADPGFRGWVEESQPMLECEPVGDGVTLLAEGELPVFRWRRHGLGEVRASAIPLTEDGLRQAHAFLPLVKLFLGAQPLFADRTQAERCLDEMTGFSVPGPGVVRRIFLVYFLLLAAIMALGFRIRRSMAAWGVGALLGLLVTMLVLQRAASGGGEAQDGRLLAMLEIAAGGVTEGFYGLFSQKDAVADLPMPDTQSLPSAIPPPGSAFRLGMMGAEGGGEPVEIAVHDARFGIRGLTVRSNTSRTFTVLAGSGPQPSWLAAAPPPELALGGQAPVLAPWPLPEGRPPEAAWLLFPSGVLPLAVDGGSLVLPRPDGAPFQGNEIIRAVQDFLQVGCRKPTVCLAWMEAIDAGRFPLPEQVIGRGRRIHLLPVRETWRAGPDGGFVVEPEQVVLSPADSSTRMLMAGNRLRQDGSSPRMIQDMTLRFHLPQPWAALAPRRIELAFDLVNPAGNLSVSPVLLPDSGPGRPAPPLGGREVQARQEGRLHVFADGLDGLLDPHEGTGLLRLKFTNRDEGRADGTTSMRLNHWQIGNLRLRIVGTLPEGVAGASF